MIPKTSPPKRSAVRIHFADTTELDEEQVHLCAQGLAMFTKWPFALGSELEFAFEHEGTRHQAVGVVIACRPVSEPERHYATVLYFTEPLCPKLQQAARSCRLSRSDALPAEFLTAA